MVVLTLILVNNDSQFQKSPGKPRLVLELYEVDILGETCEEVSRISIISLWEVYRLFINTVLYFSHSFNQRGYVSWLMKINDLKVSYIVSYHIVTTW